MNMTLLPGLIVLLCSLSGSHQKQPCKGPPYLTGQLLGSVQDEEKFWNYEYNTALQRMRVYETEHDTNRSFTYEYLLHFREGVMFEIDGRALTCIKRAIRTDYQPIGIPHNALYSEKYVMGSLSVPNAGVSLDIWIGNTNGEEVYSMFATEEGCVPFFTVYLTEKYGRVPLIFMNSTVHMTPLDDLSPPRLCSDTSMNSAARPADLLSLLSKSKARHLTRVLSKLKEVYLNNYTVL